MTRYLDIHVIQTVPPSNLNRDDAGSPKQAMYGGRRRARVSSQSWKRAVRLYLAQNVVEIERATRTQRLQRMLVERIMARTGVDATVAARISSALRKTLNIKDGKNAGNTGDTAYLLFFGRSQLESVVDQVVALMPDIAELDDAALADALGDVSLAAALAEGHPADVALFGRMVADLPHLNVDAAVQVAHALSTHGADTEFDFFTAVDDEKSRDDGDDAGAGMIGTVEFNSATLYRFATLGIDLLAENLDGDAALAATTARRFVEGFVKSMPTGKQNAFAHRTLPDAVVAAIRDDQPVNLVSAFEDPVRPPYARNSIDRLAVELKASADLWGSEPVKVLATYRPATDDGVAEVLGPTMTFEQLLDAVESVLTVEASDS